MAVPQPGGYRQVFESARVVGAHEDQCRLVMKVPPLPAYPAHVLVGLGEQNHRLLAPVTALRATGDAALGLRQALLPAAVVAGMLHPVALRRHQEDGEAHVSAGLPSGGRQRLERHVGTGEADVAAIRLPRQGDGLGRACERPMEPHGTTPNLGPAQHASVQYRTSAILGRGEGVVPLSALEARKADLWLSGGDPAEERLRSPLHPAQHSLEDRGMDLSILGEGDFEVGQLGGLLVGGGTVALPASPPRAPLLQRRVVEDAAPPEDRPQRLGLGGCWL